MSILSRRIDKLSRPSFNRLKWSLSALSAATVSSLVVALEA